MGTTETLHRSPGDVRDTPPDPGRRPQLVVANIGDSRALLIRDGKAGGSGSADLRIWAWEDKVSLGMPRALGAVFCREPARFEVFVFFQKPQGRFQRRDGQVKISQPPRFDPTAFGE